MDHAPRVSRTPRQKWAYGALCGGLSLLVLSLAVLFAFLLGEVASAGFEKYGPKPAEVIAKTAFPAETRLEIRDGYVDETTTEAAWVLIVKQGPEEASFSVEVDEETFEATKEAATVCVHHREVLPLGECKLT